MCASIWTWLHKQTNSSPQGASRYDVTCIDAPSQRHVMNSTSNTRIKTSSKRVRTQVTTSMNTINVGPTRLLVILRKV